MNIDEMKDRIARAEEIQRYTENRCEVLEKENAELKKRVENQKSFLERIRAKFELGEIERKEIEGYLESDNLTKAKELLAKWVELFKPKGGNIPPTPIQVATEQFLNGENKILEDAQVGNSPFDADEVFHKEMKAYPDETLGISDIHKYSHKLFDAFEKLEFRTTFNKAIQAFYLEEGLYVVRYELMGKYQYTLVKASSEEMAIRKCM